MDPTTVAVDVAKTVFELALADARGHIVGRRRLTRRQFERFLTTHPASHVVMEACGTAHHWGRVARAHGHRVSLLPAQYVAPYVRRHKTDRTDAEALVEATRSGAVPTVAVKTVVQQELLALHRLRQQWMRTRTARINGVRGLLREQGLTLPPGARTAVASLPALIEDADAPIPARLRAALGLVYEEVRALEARIRAMEKQLADFAAHDAVATRLQEVPGVGLLTATALVASVGHVHGFRRGRQFASWLGLTPREHSSGWRRRLGAITKQGDVYLRYLVTHGARAVLLASYRRQRAGKALSPLQHWALAVAKRRGHNKATIAVANKLARIIWAVWHRDVPFQSVAAAQAAA
jgi:transposase